MNSGAGPWTWGTWALMTVKCRSAEGKQPPPFLTGDFHNPRGKSMTEQSSLEIYQTRFQDPSFQPDLKPLLGNTALDNPTVQKWRGFSSEAWSR